MTEIKKKLDKLIKRDYKRRSKKYGLTVEQLKHIDQCILKKIEENNDREDL